MSEVGHVTRLEYEGKEILLVGTAHVSQRSVEEVQRVISEERPDTVCVELDEKRLETLTNPDVWRKMDIFRIIREKRVLFLLSNLALSSYQKKMGERLGVRPGAELLAAVTSAKEVGAELVLADREVQATLKRTWARLSFSDKLNMGSSLFVAPFAVEELDEDRLDQLKDSDTIGEMMQQLATEMPRVKEPLIDERDAFLMAKIQEAPGKKIVAIVGAAHVSGMITRLGKSADFEALSEIPPPSKLVKNLKWLIPALVMLAFGWGWYKNSGTGLEELLYAWALPNAIAAGLFSTIALAHPLTILTAFFASPITSLNPTLSAGMVAGLVEAYLRKPTVEDFEGLTDSMNSVKSFYANRVTRVFLVFVMATLGSALGAYIGIGWMISLL